MSAELLETYLKYSNLLSFLYELSYVRISD